MFPLSIILCVRVFTQRKFPAIRYYVCVCVCLCVQFGADVVSCVRNANTDQVTALDGWNPQSRASTVDTIQDVLLFSGSYMGNRISCS